MAISTTPHMSAHVSGAICSPIPRTTIPTKVPISHIQLRSLIICPNESGIVNYIQDKAIVEHDFNETSPANNPPRPLVTLYFTPNSIAGLHIPSINRTLYAAGGQEAELSISAVSDEQVDPRNSGNWYRPRREVEFSRETNLGSSINNSVLLTTSGEDYTRPEPRVVVSNNDHTVRFYDIAMGYSQESDSKGGRDTIQGSVSQIGCVKFPAAINHSSISPDGRTLLSVGDSPHVHLTRLSGSATVSCEPIASIDLPPAQPAAYAYSASEHGYGYGSGASFSTAFNKDGSKYAVASQDGIVAVWDVRSSKPLKTWSTCPASPPWSHASSCPPWSVRCVAFSKGKQGRETMAFTEHSSGKVHVVDARTFETEQVIEVPTPGEIPTHVQHLLANRQTGMSLLSGNTRREVDRILPTEDNHHRFSHSLPTSFYGFGREDELDDDDDMEIDAYPPIPPQRPRHIPPLRVMRRGPGRTFVQSPPASSNLSPEGLDLAGVCFDPSGSRMYVASSGSLTEWDVIGAEKRWFYDDSIY